MQLLYIKVRVSVGIYENGVQILINCFMFSGMTIPKVIVKVNRTEFSHGLLYTACSRVKNQQDLAIIGYKPFLMDPNKFWFPPIQRYVGMDDKNVIV